MCVAYDDRTVTPGPFPLVTSWAPRPLLDGSMADAPADELRQQIASTWHGLRAELGDLGVAEAAFVEHVEQTITERLEGSTAAPEDVLDRLVLPDVYLVLGCLGGSNRAAQLFLDRFGAYLKKLCRRHAHTDTVAEEAEAVLLATLFVDHGEKRARLSDYRGLGTLQGWLRVTAYRKVLDLARSPRYRSTASADDDDATERLADAGRTHAAHLESAQAAAGIRRLLTDCIDALEPEAREMMRRYYVDGLVLRELAALHDTDITRIHRTLAKARKAVWRTLHARARDELGLDERDLKALIGDIADGMEMGDLFAVACLLLAAVPEPVWGMV